MPSPYQTKRQRITKKQGIRTPKFSTKNRPTKNTKNMKNRPTRNTFFVFFIVHSLLGIICREPPFLVSSFGRKLQESAKNNDLLSLDYKLGHCWGKQYKELQVIVVFLVFLAFCVLFVPNSNSLYSLFSIQFLVFICFSQFYSLYGSVFDDGFMKIKGFRIMCVSICILCRLFRLFLVGRCGIHAYKRNRSSPHPQEIQDCSLAAPRHLSLGDPSGVLGNPLGVLWDSWQGSLRIPTGTQDGWSTQGAPRTQQVPKSETRVKFRPGTFALAMGVTGLWDP
jgi:uncharacterized membrane protein YhaH (DUF805 family)